MTIEQFVKIGVQACHLMACFPESLEKAIFCYFILSVSEKEHKSAVP